MYILFKVYNKISCINPFNKPNTIINIHIYIYVCVCLRVYVCVYEHDIVQYYFTICQQNVT